MPTETMSPRERWQAVLERRTPDRVPMDLWATDEAIAKVLRHLGCDAETALARLHIDLPLTLTPEYVGPGRGGADYWGIESRPADYGAGVYLEAVTHPLAAYESVEEIEANYTWPSPDWFDCSVLPRQVRGNEHRPIRGGGSEPFLVYKDLRGGQQAFMDLLVNPGIVRHCLDRMFDFHYELTRRIFETVPGQVSITYVAEDLGAQDGLMYAPEHIRAFLLPGMRRMAELTRQHGSHVFFHSDGAVRAILPDMLDIGVEVLNPVQWRCPGMERAALKRDFGDRLVFHGGVDNQQTLPFGAADDVREEVADNLRLLGADGGYILAPCHNIQAVSPPENVVALYEAGYQLGWY